MLHRTCLICNTGFSTYSSLNKRYCCKECANRSKKGRYLTEKQKQQISITMKSKNLKLPEWHKEKLRQSHLGENNWQWKGDQAGLGSIHQYVRRRLIMPIKCSNCEHKVARLDLANISGKYLRDLSDWEWLCRKCHMLKDGRLKKFNEFRNKWLEEVKNFILKKKSQEQVINREVVKL